MNPCIDCKIFMLRKAREFMESERASFVLPARSWVRGQ